MRPTGTLPFLDARAPSPFASTPRILDWPLRTPYALSKSKAQFSRRERQFVRTALRHVSLDLVYFPSGYTGDRYMIHATDRHSGFHFALTVRTVEQHHIVRFCRIIYAIAQYCGKPVLAMGSNDSPAYGLQFDDLLLRHGTL